jgi:hypothetical protein
MTRETQISKTIYKHRPQKMSLLLRYYAMFLLLYVAMLCHCAMPFVYLCCYVTVAICCYAMSLCYAICLFLLLNMLLLGNQNWKCNETDRTCKELDLGT